MFRVFKFIIILSLNALFWQGCAGNRWLVSQATGNYQAIGWEKCYQAYLQDQTVYISISVGHDKNGYNKLAIDWQQIGNTESFRLYVLLNQNQTTDISLFRFLNRAIQGNSFNDYSRYWKSCRIRTLPYLSIFPQLPTDIQSLVLKAIAETDRKFSQNGYYGR